MLKRSKSIFEKNWKKGEGKWHLIAGDLLRTFGFYLHEL